MAGLVHDGPFRFTGCRGGGGEARPQAVSGEPRWIVAELFDVPFYDDCDTFPGKPVRKHAAVPVHRAKERSRLNPRRIAPGFEGSDGAGRLVSAIRNAQCSSLPFLVGFASTDGESDAATLYLDILDVKAYEFGATEGARKTEQQESPVPFAG